MTDAATAAAGPGNGPAPEVGATRPDAFVSGVGETEPVAADPRSIPEIVLEAVESALADAGIGYSDVDAVVTASVDLYDGLTASNIAVTEVVGAVMKPETRVAGDGLAALAQAACMLWARSYETVLVVAHGKASMAPQDAISQWALDPVLLQSLGFGFDAYAGLQAQARAATDPGAVRRWAQAAAGARGCSAADVLDSPLIADPLRELMRAPDADGASAVVLTARQRPGVCLTGVGFDLDQHLPGDRELTAWTSLTRAFDRALRSARATREEIDFVEASCRFPHEVELFAAATGVRPGDWRTDGVVPVAAGLGRFITATRALRDGVTPRLALAHGTWGPAGQAHAVALLRADGVASANPAADPICGGGPIGGSPP